MTAERKLTSKGVIDDDDDDLYCAINVHGSVQHFIFFLKKADPCIQGTWTAFLKVKIDWNYRHAQVSTGAPFPDPRDT